jgi:uncharacterized protein
VRVILSLSQIGREPLPFDERLVLSAERLDPDRVLGEMEVQLAGVVCESGGAYLVSGSISAAGRLACARCLEPVPWTLQEDFSAEYRVAGEAPTGDGDIPIPDDELDVSFVDGGELDLADVAAEQVMLGLPMRTLCDESCAGLCPKCGANRNRQGACSCEDEPDPRWQALRDLVGHGSSN